MTNPAIYYPVIKKPVVTEKSTILQDTQNQYSFRVHPDANKPQIKKAVETLFKVHVEKINIISMPGKTRRMMGRPGHSAPWKKALIKLRTGERIDLTT